MVCCMMYGADTRYLYYSRRKHNSCTDPSKDKFYDLIWLVRQIVDRLNTTFTLHIYSYRCIILKRICDA